MVTTVPETVAVADPTTVVPHMTACFTALNSLPRSTVSPVVTIRSAYRHVLAARPLENSST